MLIVAVMIGCGGGGSGDVAGNGGTGGTGGNENPPPPPPPDDGPVQVEGPNALIQWSAAPGPVAGYRVLVSRNGGGFQVEIVTTGPSANVKGEPGDLVRVRVAAFDAFGNAGPFSPASDPFKFVAAAPPPPPADDGSGDDGGTPPGGDGGEVAGGGSTGGTGGGTPPGESPEEPSGPVRPYDLDGDGWVDLVWQSADGSLLRVTSVDLEHARVFSLPAGGWRVAAAGDFDGDGASDLLFAGSGQLAVARGSALRAGPGELTLESWASMPDGLLVGATGDFDADAARDVAVLSNGGSSYIALGSGTNVVLPAIEPDHAPVGAGDADGDHVSDLFVQGPAGVSLWRVVDGAVVSTQSLPAPSGAAVEGVGDFDGNGSADLAFRTGPGELTIQHTLEPFESWTEAVPAGAALAGCRDYDGDGALDRLWLEPEALHLVTASGAQTIPLETDSTWRLVRDCK